MIQFVKSFTIAFSALLGLPWAVSIVYELTRAALAEKRPITIEINVLDGSVWIFILWIIGLVVLSVTFSIKRRIESTKVRYFVFSSCLVCTALWIFLVGQNLYYWYSKPQEVGDIFVPIIFFGLLGIVSVIGARKNWPWL